MFRFTFAQLIAAVVVTCLLLASGRAVYLHGLLSLRMSFMEDQIDVFHQMEVDAIGARPEQAVQKLAYIIFYYPSGSKQEAGSRGDRIVEKCRENSIRRIISYLRQETEKDYGDDPEAWIEAFPPEVAVPAPVSVPVSLMWLSIIRVDAL